MKVTTSMNMISKTAIVMMAALFVSGCAGLAGPPAHLYGVSPLKGEGGQTLKTSPVIVVEELTASRALNSDRIPVRPSAHEIQYLADSRFADRIPAMLRSVIAQSLENVAGYPSISGKASGLYSEYLLRGTIRNYEVDVTNGAGSATVHVDLGIRIVNFRTSRLLGARHFTASVKADNMLAPSVAAAFDAATGQTSQEIIDWAARLIEDDQARLHPAIMPNKSEKPQTP